MEVLGNLMKKIGGYMLKDKRFKIAHREATDWSHSCHYQFYLVVWICLWTRVRRSKRLSIYMGHARMVFL